MEMRKMRRSLRKTVEEILTEEVSVGEEMIIAPENLRSM